jgi:hypothetical protein
VGPTDLSDQAIGLRQGCTGHLCGLPIQVLPFLVFRFESVPSVPTPDTQGGSRQGHGRDFQDQQQDPVDQFVADPTHGRQFLATSLVVLAPVLPGTILWPPAGQSLQCSSPSCISTRLPEGFHQDLDGQFGQFVRSIELTRV